MFVEKIDALQTLPISCWPLHEVQLLNYLKAAGLEIGLLINKDLQDLN